MDNQSILAIADELINRFNEHDASRFASLHSESATIYGPSTSPILHGRGEIEQFFGNLFSNWPDCRWTKLRAFTEGNFLCMQWTFNGSSTSHPDTPVETWDCGVFKIAGDEIEESRIYYDTGSVIKQWEAAGTTDDDE